MNQEAHRCPTCHEIGTSVAAIRAKGVSRGETDGNFTGRAIGVSLGNKGMGGGLAGISGEFQSETNTTNDLAKIFEPPLEPVKPENTEQISPLCIAAVVFTVIAVLLTIMNHMSVIGIIISVLLAVGSVFLCMKRWKTPMCSDEQFGELMAEYEKEFKQFNSVNEKYLGLRYCDRCHLIFDNQKNTSQANSSGFHHLMVQNS